jgi:hypothetical protein
VFSGYFVKIGYELNSSFCIGRFKAVLPENTSDLYLECNDKARAAIFLNGIPVALMWNACISSIEVIYYS